jgi:hypothetical protein
MAVVNIGGAIAQYEKGLYVEGGKCGYIDKTGREVVPIKYDEASKFSEGMAEVRLGSKWGFVDKVGNEVVSFKYDEAARFSEGMAAVRLGDKWGWISIHALAKT